MVYMNPRVALYYSHKSQSLQKVSYFLGCRKTRHILEEQERKTAPLEGDIWKCVYFRRGVCLLSVLYNMLYIRRTWWEAEQLFR
jgi:hypothetical protein